MSKHTPGPWRIGEGIDDGYEIYAKNGNPIGSVHWTIKAGTEKAPAEANARLIAAAPELLEALKWTHGKYSEFMDYDHKDCEVCPLIARAEAKP